MKLLLPLSVALACSVTPAFAECVAPLNDVKIPNGNKATMEEMVAANHAMQENTTEVEAYFHCLKAEQSAKIDAIGLDITDDQRAKIASEYVNRQHAETEKLQNLADRYDIAERKFRAKQAAVESTDEANEETAAVNGAEQDATEKERHEAAALKPEGHGNAAVVPKSHAQDKGCAEFAERSPSSTPGESPIAQDLPPCNSQAHPKTDLTPSAY